MTANAMILGAAPWQSNQVQDDCRRHNFSRYACLFQRNRLVLWRLMPNAASVSRYSFASIACSINKATQTRIAVEFRRVLPIGHRLLR
jgi:hypothetical protein